MHYLVTGGAGFIGNTLVLRLLKEGHEVTVIDSVNPYYDPSLKEARLKRLPDSVTVYRADIVDYAAMAEIFSKHSFDAICHLAAQAGVRYSLEHPDVYVQTNYVGTFNIINLAHQHGIKKIAMASTSSVYGTSKDMPFREDNPVFEPMSIYAATKRATELLAATYAHLYGMEITALRFFTVYGPWGRPDMALYIFTNKILKGEAITVFNHGNMRRDFTYVDDIVDGFYRTLTTTLPGFEIINLGNSTPVQLMDFIQCLEDKLGKKAIIDFQPIQAGDVPETSANIDKAKTLLGYEPKTAVKEGVGNFVDWYQSYYA